MEQYKERIDLIEALLHKIRLEGFQIISRKYGKYLPSPQPVGSCEIDILAKRNGSYAIGLTLVPNDFSQPNLAERIEFLATRTSKFSKLPVILFIGVEQSNYVRLAHVLQSLSTEVRSQIRSYPLMETPDLNLFMNNSVRQNQNPSYIN